MAISNAITTTVPDLVLLDSITKGINAIRYNYNSIKADVTKNVNTDSFLGIIFKGLSQVENFNAFDTAVQLLITTPQNPKHITPSLSWNSTTSKYPAIILHMPSESDKNNSMGIGEGNQEELYDSISGTWAPQFVRRFNVSYQIMIMSDNKNEVIVLYHFIKSLLIALYDHLAQNGISNPVMSGGDLSFRPDVPDRTFIRQIGLAFEYESSSAQINLNQVINQVNVTLFLDEDEGSSESDSW